MKRTFTSIILVLLTSLCLQLHAQSPSSDITGVYRYLLEDAEGMGIVTPTHFIWVLADKDRHHFANSEPTEAEKISAFEAQNVAAGTWRFSGNQQATFTFTHHYNANQLGQSFTWEYEREGDLYRYWILGEDGSRGPLQQSRRVASWNAKGSCDAFNGVWEYQDRFTGIYIQSGGYGAWMIMPDKSMGLSTPEGKAKAFDGLNAKFVMGDCSKTDKQFWTVLHAADLREEKLTIGSTSKELKPDLFEWDLLNQTGKPIGALWQTRRIAK